jgi:hypothetical protein
LEKMNTNNQLSVIGKLKSWKPIYKYQIEKGK